MAAAVAVIVLAAGRGSRFAGPGHKLEQPFDRSTVLGTTLRNVVRSALPVVVVTTARLATLAADHLASRDVVVIPEADGSSPEPLGMGYSIAVGVSARAQAGGWLVLPGDMPLVRPDSLHAVADALADHPAAYAQHRGRRGHPVAFSAELYSELVLLSGDEGARRLLARYPARAVEVDDPGVLADVDTVADLERLDGPRARADLAPADPLGAG
ncbi:nucleotidyltransferase family protein [Piscinibacter sakaiensis]|uniref:CTP:molybdopterin cytidylyltransferase n=1 Tax=Piscinibacter sakaiensis TaxID=1547922 RepID=A0A0K8P0M5_PISS1|nr:nucleotidyltransferase family protein [Piscinibacter sakaiensis]GAP35720.1 CTP:molybdopterin cytidylyltransferase [Piscinibacter sakaiensis]